MRHFAHEDLRVWALRVSGRHIAIEGIESVEELEGLVERLAQRGYAKLNHTIRRPHKSRKYLFITLRMYRPISRKLDLDSRL
jgi:hypothetical protein